MKLLPTLTALCSLTILVFTHAVLANNVRWHNYSSSVFNQAKQHHQSVMLFAMTDSCYWCQQMAETTFKSDAVASMINENFYPVMLHADQNRAAFKQLQLTGVPTIIFYSDDGRVNGAYEGYQQTSDMLEHLSEMIAARH